MNHKNVQMSVSEIDPGAGSAADPRASEPASARWVVAALAALTLVACATTPPAPAPAPQAPARWHAALPTPPHRGQSEDLALWWQQFSDPQLAALIDAAQAVSPTLASARSRIEQARADRRAAGAVLLPNVDAGASASRGRFDLVSPVATTMGASVSASWELDVFGANRAGADAAQARLEGAEASWHDARVLVAAEVANSYVSLRACEAQVVQAEADTRSRAEVARLTELSVNAGTRAPAAAALARASAAQGRHQLEAQRLQCELLVKSLVALTGLDEPALRSQLAARVATLPQPAQIGVTEVPAEVLNQRPDLFSAARDVVAAAADVSQAQAQRLPRVSLAGSIGPSRFEGGGITETGTVWSIGPVQVSLPLFDGGARAANVDRAQARYDEATALYRSRVRAAVREVEEALSTLQSTARRGTDAQVAVADYEVTLTATNALFQGGLASLFDLEDARRNAVAARRELIELQRERVAAWIALYAALGGGWTPKTGQALTQDRPQVGEVRAVEPNGATVAGASN